MPLSEHEQRVLEQIERSLLDEDPKFRAAVKKSGRRGIGAGSLRLAISLAVLGLVVLVGGVWLQNVIVGVLGFLIMLSGGIIGLRAAEGGPADSSVKPKGKGAKPGASSADKGGMAAKAQDRLRRRFEEQ